jgi:hypothetical protein
MLYNITYKHAILQAHVIISSECADQEVDLGIISTTGVICSSSLYTALPCSYEVKPLSISSQDLPSNNGMFWFKILGYENGFLKTFLKLRV